MWFCKADKNGFRVLIRWEKDIRWQCGLWKTIWSSSLMSIPCSWWGNGCIKYLPQIALNKWPIRNETSFNINFMLATRIVMPLPAFIAIVAFFFFFKGQQHCFCSINALLIVLSLPLFLLELCFLGRNS